MPLKLLALGLAVALPLIAPAAVAAERPAQPQSKPRKPQAARLQASLTEARSLVVSERAATWACQRALGRTLYRSMDRHTVTTSRAYLRWLAGRWHDRRAACEDQREHLLRDWVVSPGNRAWSRAVAEVQRAYPGTSGWLFSCSWSEGKWGRWVSYGGLYTPEYAAAHYVVGGWLQFKLPTFKGFFRHASSDVRSRGFLIPGSLRAASDIEAWQSPLAQALAGAWALRAGYSYHWAGSGC